MPKISIIVPIYNVKAYLPQCLDSILAQTFSDVEIICVDDGSNDGSEKIVDQYTAKDSRIVAIHKPNAGYGAAMNTGLDAATGEYIGIVESDDCIMPEMYQRLYDQAKSNDLDFIKSEAYFWFESLDFKKRIHVDSLEPYFNKALDQRYRNIFFDFFMNIWTGIYKTVFLKANDIRFNESPGASYQDNGFWMQTCMYAQRAMWLDEAFYLYRQDNPEASIKSTGKIYAMENEYSWLEDQLKSRGHYHLLPYCYYYRLFRDRGVFLRIADELKSDYVTHLKDEYAKYGAAIKMNGFLDKWMRDITDDSQTLLNTIIDKKSFVVNKLNEAHSIIIYGAGNRGVIALRNLVNLNQISKLKCFAVTYDTEEEMLANHQVLKIDDAIKKYPDSLIIVATVRGTNAYKAMCINLLDLEVTNYLDGTLFEEYFYLA